MNDDWILDVLADLRVFVEKKGMHATADILTDACLLAAADLKVGRARWQQELMDLNDGGAVKISGIHPAC
ncbi:hypothetical protein SAMN05444421_10761 [Celeribacter marinus]|uniref:Uncharacterized protein n=1 Tax=Celeribacter marinus TaxID=1397108 RepID=A0A0P0AEI4_9RHOB|nr:hypothetical protein [Celeribacter marinus]ALI56953.1 hypothetical protein IMCC12053_3006 [Celeribacter marinus]SFK69366.1 hypothetical protein SAMN05444421_10761 [Celeribacter marinus]